MIFGSFLGDLSQGYLQINSCNGVRWDYLRRGRVEERYDGWMIIE